ncbi:uncharacterized protein [Palaemon carinicauda]|uniref:uncharacterized protein n=1 Tax=Palaemon carinicauda TaxID=392227 RepID=UPI0035B6A8E0
MTKLKAMSLFMEHNEEHRESTFIYTNGSKSDAGFGFVVTSSSFNCRGALPPISSIFTAELYGILTAIEKIALKEEDNLTIFSDSRSVLQALEDLNSSNPLVLKILELLLTIGLKGITVRFCWDPAHVGVSGNEEAGSLAKIAAGELLPRRIEGEPHQGYPHSRTTIEYDNSAISKMADIPYFVAILLSGVPW